MPIARIRTFDIEAISFLAAKLAESGFEVQFAVPGESLSGEVDLEITVDTLKKPAEDCVRNLAASAAVSADSAGTWTTPYHVEAPAISENTELGDEFKGLDIPWNDRELARILTTGSNRTYVEPGEFQEQPTEVSRGAEGRASTELRIVEAPQPPSVSQPPAPRYRPDPVKRVFKPAGAFSSHSLRQRFASVAALVTLAVTAVFSLTLSGDRAYSSRAEETPAVRVQSLVPPPPILTPPSTALRLASADLGTKDSTTASSERPVTLAKNEAIHVAHKKQHPSRTAHRRRVPPVAKVPPPVEEQEVIIRHFPAGDER